MLRKNGFSLEQFVALVADFHDPAAGLEAEEISIMEFVQKVIRSAHEITEDDHRVLRDHGLTDEEILDVVLAATVRSFYSKTLDAVGTPTDEAYADMEAALNDGVDWW